MNDVNNFARNLLAARGRRTVATLLTYLEDNVWQYVPEHVQREARGRVLATVGEFQDLAMDMITADTGTINEFWVEQLDGLHEAIKAMSNGG